MKIGKRIQKAREAKGLSRQQLAALLHERLDVVQQWEAGNERLDDYDVRRLIEALDMDAEDLYVKDYPVLKIGTTVIFIILTLYLLFF